jgi:hypothetical protein
MTGSREPLSSQAQIRDGRRMNAKAAAVPTVPAVIAVAVAAMALARRPDRNA